ncbi:hypothetical protein P3G55_20680 [Leptospira sp. 96542]|nr:hypothetical protein [Leptospira sp. 96542]
MSLDLKHPVVLLLAGQIVMASGVYAAIRADLREAMVTAQVAAARADQAHARIDQMLERPRR